MQLRGRAGEVPKSIVKYLTFDTFQSVFDI